MNEKNNNNNQTAKIVMQTRLQYGIEVSLIDQKTSRRKQLLAIKSISLRKTLCPGSYKIATHGEWFSISHEL